MSIPLETRLEILETRFEGRRESHLIPGLVPYLRKAKRESESWRDFKERLGVSPGFMKLERWCRRGTMPSWWVEPVRAEIRGDEHPPNPRVPRKCSPKWLTYKKRELRREYVE